MDGSSQVIPETESGTETPEPFFQEPKLEPEPSFPVKLYRNTEEPPEPELEPRTFSTPKT